MLNRHRFLKRRYFRAKYILPVNIIASIFILSLVILTNRSNEDDKIKKILSKMSLKQKLGQMFVLDIPSDRLLPSDLTLIQSHSVGNFILMGRNLVSQQQIRSLTAKLQSYSQQFFGLPAFISIDQEGGSQIRMFRNSTVFPSFMTIAATKRIENSYKVSYLLASELRDVGINLNFSPVTDVNSNSANPIIGDRSFGDDPSFVRRYAERYIDGHKKAGVLACAKHFPGHGETTQDSHLELPKIDRTFESLTDIDLVPIKGAISRGVDMIMVGHLLTPLDEFRTCSTSRRCISYLRNDLNYNGLIITDSMVMKALSQDRYNETILEAINAGVDLICSCGKTFDISQYYAIDFLVECVNNGRLLVETIDNTVKRIIKTKLKMLESNENQEKVDYETNRDFAKSVASDGITYFNDNMLLPINKDEKIVCLEADISAEYMLEEYIEESFCKRLAQFGNIEQYRFSKKVTDEEYNTIINIAKQNETTVFVPYKSRWHRNQIDLINEYNRINSNTILVSLSDPYEFNEYQSIKTKIIGYEFSPLSVTSSLYLATGVIQHNASIPFNI